MVNRRSIKKYQWIKLLCLIGFCYLPAGWISAQISISFGVSKPSCVGAADGELTANVSGGQAPYSFFWSNGDTSSSIVGLAADFYALTVIDAFGMLRSAAVLLDDPAPINGDIVIVGCGFPVQLKAEASGGEGPYEFKWSEGSAETIEVFEEATYCVTITDANNCGIIKCIDVEIEKLDLSLIAVQPGCSEDSTGTLIAFLSDGVLPYTYAWSNGGTGQEITDLSPGEYMVTVTDANGCSATDTANIVSGAPLEIEIKKQNPICKKDSSGFIEVIPLNGDAPFKFAWNTGDTLSSINQLESGTYVVTVTDENGCFQVQTVELTPQTTLHVELDVQQQQCGQEPNGKINLIIGGGQPPYGILWNTGDTTSVLDSIAAGDYQVKITDALGCTIEEHITIEGQTTNFSTQINVKPITFCGGDNGALSLEIEPEGSYTFLWNTGDTTNSISNLGEGTYVVTITDVQGCQDVLYQQLTAPDFFELEFIGDSSVCTNNQNASLSVVPQGGIAPYQYLWSTGDSTANLDQLARGIYSVTVTDSTGCQAMEDFSIENFPEMQVTINATDLICGEDSSAYAIASVTGGQAPFNYLWSNDSSSATISNLSEGTYQLTVTDANGCLAEASTFIKIIDDFTVEISATQVTCFGDSTGSAVAVPVNGEAPFTYLWSNGNTSQLLFNIPAAAYAVTVTDKNGCVAETDFNIFEPAELAIDFTAVVDAICEGSAGGQAKAEVSGGNMPYEYMWSNGSEETVVTNLNEGTYILTVSDASGCQVVDSLSVVQFDSLQISFETEFVDCNRNNSGRIKATLSQGKAPFNYLWSNGKTNATIDSLTSGQYTLTVTDANGCQVIDSVTIAQADVLMVNAIPIKDACFESDNGSMTVQVEGGVLPYQYLWNNESELDTITDLAPGEYMVTVLDARACEGSSTATIKALAAFNCEIELVQSPSGALANDGILRAKASGGGAPFTYLWSNGQISQESTNLTVGNYAVTITDTNGCVSSCDFELPLNGTIGQLVWEDINKNGIREESEPGIAKVAVLLKDKDGNLIGTDTTDNDGRYLFENIVPDTFYLQFEFNNTFFRPSIGQKVTQEIWLRAGENQRNANLGLYKIPVSMLTSPCACLNNATTTKNGQFLEEITIESYPGEEWRLIAGTGIFQIASNPPPVNPVPVEVGTLFSEISDGVYQLNVKVVDSQAFEIFISDGQNLDTLSNFNICEYPTLSFDETLPDSLCGSDPTIDLSATSSIPGEVRIFVDGEELSEIIPANLTPGLIEVKAQLLPFNPVACEAVVVDSIIFGDCTDEVSELCDAISSAGLIVSNQSLCGPGQKPDPLQEFEPVDFMGADLEYQWMQSTVSSEFDEQLWDIIPGATTKDYTPSALYETTFFTRCVRVQGCDTFQKSNVIQVEVGSLVYANINLPEKACVGEEIVFTADTNVPDSSIVWIFDGPVMPRKIEGRAATVTYSDFGTFDIQVILSYEGCLASNETVINVLDNPLDCAGSLGLEAEITPEEKVKLAWQIPNDPSEAIFEVEHSADGIFFETIGEVALPTMIAARQEYFQYVDEQPKKGRSFYRLRMVNRKETSGTFSETKTIILYGDNKLMWVYPNPLYGDFLTIEIFENLEEDITISLYATSGVLLQQIFLDQQAQSFKMDLSPYPLGSYYLKVDFGQTLSKHFKLTRF